MNTESIVLTVIGEDKPGLVEWLATLVADHHGNWMESRMARLSGQFAGILHVEVPSTPRAELGLALSHLNERGLQISISSQTSVGAEPQLQQVTLELVGHDRPGIVRQISRVIAARGVNVQEIETTTDSAPMSGDSLFRARAVLQVPSEVELADLQTDLEQVSHDLMVDITLG
jgi:glycine cleavage system regulatory protein